MTRRGLFRTLVLAAAWAQTKHLTWAFPEPIHVIPRWMMYARIRIAPEIIRALAFLDAWQKAAHTEYAELIREFKR